MFHEGFLKLPRWSAVEAALLLGRLRQLKLQKAKRSVKAVEDAHHLSLMMDDATLQRSKTVN